MNVNERDRRADTVGRGAGQGTPRSGGRTTVQRATPDRSRNGGSGKGATGGNAAAGVRGARRYATEGTAALRVDEPVRVWDSTDAAQSVPGPRLRVAPPRPVAAPRAPFVVLVLIVVVAGVLGILMVNIRTNENAFRLDMLQKQQVVLNRHQQQLEKQIAENESPGNLDAMARKLGLVKAGPPAFIRLPDGKIIEVPKPATGQPAISSQQGNGPQGGGR